MKTRLQIYSIVLFSRVDLIFNEHENNQGPAVNLGMMIYRRAVCMAVKLYTHWLCAVAAYIQLCEKVIAP